MKTTLDIEQFSMKQEIEAVADYVTKTWAGLTEEETTSLVTKAFTRGWEESGLRHKYPTVSDEPFLVGRQVRARHHMFETQGIDYLDYHGDNVCKVLEVLSSMDTLVYDRPKDNPVDALCVELSLLLGDKTNTIKPKELVHIDSEVMKRPIFKGHYYSDGSTYHLVEQLSPDNVRYQVDEQNSSPYYELVKGLYNHGSKLRVVHNEETLGHTLNNIAINAPLTLGETPVEVPYNLFTYQALTIAAERDRDATRVFQLVSWSGKPNLEINELPTIAI